jgi:hypothetical protein
LSELVTLAEVKAFLGIDNANTQYDSLLTIFKNSVEQAIKNFCETTFEKVTVTKELYDGINSDVIVPKHFPILSVEGIYFHCDGDGNGGNKIDDEFYTVEESGIVLRDGLYTPNARKIIRLDYSYGYTAVPADVKLCALQSVKAEYQRNNQNTENLSSRGKMGESESFNSAWDSKTGLPTQIVSKLQPYRVYEFPMIGNAQRNQ